MAADFALVGFLISHFDELDEEILLKLLKESIRSDGKIFIIDSLWTDERANRKKEGKRSVNQMMAQSLKFLKNISQKIK